MFRVFSFVLLAWRIVGPGGGGSMYRPTINPHDPNTVLLACDMTGAYITHDAGRRWREFNLRTRVDAFAFDPSDVKVIYAGSSGLFRSEDAGARWRLVFPDPAAVVQERMVGDHADQSFVSRDNWPGGRVEAIAVDPARPRRLLIGIHSRGLLVYSSEDRGKTWKEVAQPPGGTFLRLWIEPVSHRAFAFTDAGVHALAPLETLKSTSLTDASCGIDAGRPVFYVATGAALLRSRDLGRTWQELETGGQSTLVAAAVHDARIAYATVRRHPQGFGIMKTEDGGQTWKWVVQVRGNENPANKKVGWLGRNYGPGWGGQPFGLGTDPSGRIAYATDSGTAYRTLDGGATWEQVYSDDRAGGGSSSRGLDVTTNYGVHFDPFDPKHLVISYTDIGLMHSLDGGESWLHTISGVPREWRNTCYWVAFDPEVKGRAWSVWANAHDLPRPKMFRGDFSRFRGGVCRTDDRLKSWKPSNAGMPPNCVTTHIVLDPRTPAGRRTLYVAGFGKGVYKSTDDGATWALRNSGLKENLNAWRLTLLPDGTLFLLVARGLKMDGAVYKSADAAATWQPVPLPQGVNAPNDLVLDPKNPKRMYLACWPRPIDGVERGGGLYVTENGGASWRAIFNASAHVYATAVDPDNPRTLFTNTFDSAAWRSDDGGRTWRRLRGYNFKWGHRPVLDPHHKGMLYLTTFGSSVWYGPAAGDPAAFEDIYPFVER